MKKTERICDICGKRIEGRDTHYILKRKWYSIFLLDTEEYTNNMDICCNCMYDFKQYVLNKKKNK